MVWVFYNRNMSIFEVRFTCVYMLKPMELFNFLVVDLGLGIAENKIEF